MKTFCCYCGRLLIYPLKDTAEHLVPLSKGGNNSPLNKARCCSLCNSWRSNSSLDFFKKNVQFHLDYKLRRKGYSKFDFEIMVENIEYWQHYIKTSKNQLYRKKLHK